MSLLIKALDKAAKNKAVDEKNKVKSTSAANPPALTLEPIAQNNLATPIKAHDMSLADEAGMSISKLNTKPARQKLHQFEQAAKSPFKRNDAQQQSVSQGVSDGSLEKAPHKTQQQTAESQLPPVFKDMAVQSVALQQKVAGSVFKANDEPKRQSSWLALILLSIAGALTIWLVWQGYLVVKTWLSSDVVMVAPAPLPTTLDDVNATLVSDAAVAPAVYDDEQSDHHVVQARALDAEENIPLSNRGAMQQKPATNVIASRSALTAEAVQNMNQDPNKQAELPHNNPSSNLTLFRKTQADAVEPAVLNAYNAFQRGDYAIAQQQYRLALQQDLRNIDALLGMAAVAQRQNRLADANGWYQKVLEIAPRNTIAQTAIAGLQVNQDIVASESRLKSLIAQQPAAAHLYAALGNLYATQQQWFDAQEAYFNASRLAPNLAEYAFNVAVSLEHLNKSPLALIQYERTLSLINSTDAVSPDRLVVEARIQALQQ